jgi:hypothetical protein
VAVVARKELVEAKVQAAQESFTFITRENNERINL